MSTNNVKTGGCMCGAVKYQFDAQSPALMAGHCQCKVCRKLSGTGHSSFVAIPNANLQLEGPTGVFTYTADSGNVVHRRFCEQCGSPICAENEGMSDMVMLCASNLDEPNWFEPSIVVYHDSATAWDYTDPKLPTVPQMPNMAEMA
jgi:hypothetical protein